MGELEEKIFCLEHNNDIVTTSDDNRKPYVERRKKIANYNAEYRALYPDRPEPDDDQGQDIADIGWFKPWDLTGQLDDDNNRDEYFLHMLKMLNLVVDDGCLDLNLPVKLKKRLTELQKEKGVFKEKKRKFYGSRQDDDDVEASKNDENENNHSENHNDDDWEEEDTRSDEAKLQDGIKLILSHCEMKVPAYYRPNLDAAETDVAAAVLEWDYAAGNGEWEQ